MKKIVFVLSMLCFFAVMNVNAQIVVPGEKATDSPQNIGKKVDTKLSPSDLKKAIKAAEKAPDIVVQGKGNETQFFRKSSSLSASNQQLVPVVFIPKTGKFVPLQEVESQDNRSNSQGLISPSSNKNNKQKKLQ